MKFAQVMFSCGHEGYVELPNDTKRRNSQISFYNSKGLCPDCYAERMAQTDSRKGKGCLKVKMSDSRYSKEYSECQYTRVGIEKDGERFVFIPKDRAAAEAVLRILGVRTDDPDYERKYRIAVEDYILRDTTEARRRLLYAEHISDDRKERMSAAFDVIEKYQESISNSQCELPIT